jgi:hypothetical protein
MAGGVTSSDGHFNGKINTEAQQYNFDILPSVVYHRLN